MVRTSKITLISSDTVLSGINDAYLVDAGTTGFTIKLPPITTDGMYYEIIRQDLSSNLVTIVATAPNVIFENLGVSGDSKSGATEELFLPPQTRATFQSYKSNWYVTATTSTARLSSRSLFNSAFVQNNGNPFITFAVNGNAFQRVCAFPYDGTGGEQIVRLTCVMAKSNGKTVLGNISIGNSTRTVVYASLDFDLSSTTGVIALSTSNITNLPDAMTPIFFFIQLRSGSSSSASINLYSVTVQ
jgi:hypothetical protein